VPAVQFGVHWETKRLEDTELGASYEVQIDALEDGALGRNVPSSGIPTSQVIAMYEVDLGAGFEALCERDWQGHLVPAALRWEVRIKRKVMTAAVTVRLRGI
jgi:hypothetical protein